MDAHYSLPGMSLAYFVLCEFGDDDHYQLMCYQGSLVSSELWGLIGSQEHECEVLDPLGYYQVFFQVEALEDNGGGC